MLIFVVDMKVVRNILCAVVLSAMISVAPAAAALDAPQYQQSVGDELAFTLEIKVVGQRVEIDLGGEEARTVLVYALTGQIVKNMTVDPGLTVVDLPAGYYIVKVDRVAKRIIVR